MKLAVALLLWATSGCAPLPSIALRLRARYQHDERRTVRTYEARVDCGWSLESRAARGGAVGVEPEAWSRGPGWDDATRGVVPCTVRQACAWEANARDEVLAAYGADAWQPARGETP